MSALPMTAEGLEGLRFELQQLRRKTHADGANNDEQVLLAARLGALEETIARAVIVDAEPTAPDVAVIGSTVTIEDVDSGAHSRYRLISAHQELGPGVISAASPMGQALIDGRPGSVVTIELPNGRSRSVRLLTVEPPATDGP